MFQHIMTQILLLLKIFKTGSSMINLRKDFNWKSILKYSLLTSVFSLVLGIIFFSQLLNTTEITGLHTIVGYVVYLGFMPYSFFISLAICSVLIVSNLEDINDALFVGFLSGLVVGLLEYPLLHFIYGEFGWMLFTNYIGDQTIFLIALGVIMAYIGNVYLKGKFNLLSD